MKAKEKRWRGGEERQKEQGGIDELSVGGGVHEGRLEKEEGE